MSVARCARGTLEHDLRAFRRGFRTIPFVLIGSGIFVWAVGFHQFAELVPTDPSRNTDVDAVIVLTGGQGRLAAGLELLEANPRARLLVSGVGAGVRAADLSVPESMQPRVDLGRTAVDTVGNAVESRLWAEEHGIRSAILVTSAVHLQRSMLLFRELAPDLDIVPHPVIDLTGSMQRGSLGWYVAVANEYSKSLVMRIVFAFGGSDYIGNRS